MGFELEQLTSSGSGGGGGGGSSFVAPEIYIVDSVIATSNQIILGQTPVQYSEFVILNGLILTPGGAYSYEMTGPTIDFTAGILSIGDIVDVRYMI